MGEPRGTKRIVEKLAARHGADPSSPAPPRILILSGQKVDQQHRTKHAELLKITRYVECVGKSLRLTGEIRNRDCDFCDVTARVVAGYRGDLIQVTTAVRAL